MKTLLAALTLIFTIFSLSVASSQVPERRIDRKPQGPNEPVTIVSVSNKRASLDLNTKFVDDEDWLKGLSFQLINSYHKGIRYVSLDLLFPRPKGETEPPFITNLTYGDDPEGTSKERTKLLRPGETVTLKLSDAEHESVRKLLRNLNYPDTIVQVTIRLDHVVFEDGALWKAGLFFRREKDPKKWVPVEMVVNDFPCPTIRIICFEKEKCDGPNIRLAAEVMGAGPEVTPTYTWCVSAGTITKGQYTASIEINANQIKEEWITVVVIIGGLDRACDKYNTYRVEVRKPAD